MTTTFDLNAALTKIQTILEHVECVARSAAGDACGECMNCGALGAAVALERDIVAALRPAPAQPEYLTEEERNFLREKLLQSTLDMSFGDGQERDMVVEGCTFPGLVNMSDAELLEEFTMMHGELDGDDRDSVEELAAAFRRFREDPE
jgi:hypothetical protein